MRKIITLLFLTVTLTAAAQDFDRYFEDATLRLDYIFAGNDWQKYLLKVTGRLLSVTIAHRKSSIVIPSLHSFKNG